VSFCASTFPANATACSSKRIAIKLNAAAAAREEAAAADSPSESMFRLLRGLVTALGLFAAAATLLSFHRGSHWLVRTWDFPRVQLATTLALSSSLFRAFFFRRTRSDHLFLSANLLALLWQGWKILPFTRLARNQVKRSAACSVPERSFRLLIANVMLENDQPERLLEVIYDSDPDIVLVVETDARWAAALSVLRNGYPHRVEQPQDNYYGLLLFSRLPLIEPAVKFLVQEDIPSVHTGLELRSGDHVFLHGLHPRPPEPLRDQNSTARDAELVLVGRAIRDAGDRPTIVAGDLNDVAWSATTELFVRLSGLLDPRVGRGFYNSFHADKLYLRYPLDHVFHSNHFTLTDLQILPHIGSDHFPVLIELCLEPEVQSTQPKPRADRGDEEEADEKLQRGYDAAQSGEDRPNDEG
jgi:endonuclease/exonuclease/phosphatase (EEP) superfamily protein YafD